MNSLDRTAVVVRPRTPYFVWARRVGAPVDPAQLERTATVYLLPDFAEWTDADRLIDQHWQDLFEHELRAWEPDRGYWPTPRTPALFRQWFRVEVVAEVLDLAPIMAPE